eukprot:scaffold10393_cov114-Isochrysis_galbana.AAC.6
MLERAEAVRLELRREVAVGHSSVEQDATVCPHERASGRDGVGLSTEAGRCAPSHQESTPVKIQVAPGSKSNHV